MLKINDYDSIQSLPEIFFKNALFYEKKPFLWYKKDHEYKSYSWHFVFSQIRRLSKVLESFNVQDGARVVLLSENRPEWLILDLTIMNCGGITVPIYTSCTEDGIQFIVSDCQPTVVIASQQCLSQVLAVQKTMGEHFKAEIFCIDQSNELGAGLFNGLTPDVSLTSYRGDKPLRREDTACIIYTSGTGGTPKGVMLSHGAIISNLKGCYTLLKPLKFSEERFLSFLPASHAYEHTAGLMFPMSIGAEIFYTNGFESLSQDIQAVQPTIMTAVPRLYQVLKNKIETQARRQSASKQKHFEKTLQLGRKSYEKPGSLNLTERLKNTFICNAVRAKVHQKLGGELKAFISGGAALDYETAMFFHALDVPILQGYGQTESAPVVSCNIPGKVRLETVGQAFPDVEIKIADDGEILVRGELVMQGYWNNQEATTHAIRDGWLYTGDIGTLDSNGYLQITDRKKDIIVTPGGDTLSPYKIASALEQSIIIDQAVVYQHPKESYLFAILSPTQANKNISYTDNIEVLRQQLQEAIDAANSTLPTQERIKRFIIATEPFSIDNGLMTPTLKLRREHIRKHYQKQLHAL